MACAVIAQCDFHGFSDIEELHRVRAGLLQWYDSGKRELPWRTIAIRETDPNVRAYAVWVSEVMLQQTQVATVVDYFNRWIKRWPTVATLANATLEEVKEMWAGLGYYSRGQRLWEAAKKVMVDLGGEVPRTVDLLKTLPGVGRYTASAVASIAFGERCGVVDGNVVRVFSRHRAIGADTSNKKTMEHFWELSSTGVDNDRPGDFNQALMELGATLCTPKSPKCETCPIKRDCRAYQTVSEKKHSIARGKESQSNRGTAGCSLCLPHDQPWIHSLGVMNYPRKARKKPPRNEHYAVAIVEYCEGETSPMFLIRQRPDTGLLAGMWEFPSAEVQSDWSEQQMWQELKRHLHLQGPTNHTHLGILTHQFTHTHHNYHVWHVILGERLNYHDDGDNTRWVNHHEIMTAAISTAVKKMYQLLTQTGTGGHRQVWKRKSSGVSCQTNKKQRTLDTFLTTS